MRGRYMNSSKRRVERGLSFHFVSRLILMSCLLSAVIIYLLINLQKQLMLGEHTEFAITVAENLVANSEYGFITGDREILQSVINGIKKDRDVFYASIVENGKNRATLAEYNEINNTLPVIKKRIAKTKATIRTLGKKTVIIDVVSPIILSTSNLIDEDSLFIGERTTGKKADKGKIVGYVRLGVSLEQDLLDLEKTSRKVIFTILLLISIFALYQYLQMKNIVIIPLQKIIKGAKEFGKGNLDYKVEVAQGNEIGELANAFNLAISERKKSGAELKNSEERLRSILDNSSSAIYIKDIHGKHILVNRHFSSIFNMTFENIKGITDYDLFPSDVADSIKEKDQIVLKTKKPIEYEETVVINGKQRIYFSTKFPLLNTNNDVYALCGISTDITKHKRAEEALNKSEEKFHSYIESAPDGIFIADSQGKYRDVNSAACKLLGYSKEELLTMSIPDILEPVCVDRALEDFNQLMRKGEFSGEYVYLKKDGTLFDMSLDAVKISDNMYLGFTKDITDRKKAEETLRDFTRKLVESQESERKRIAAELHDSLAQDLLVITNEIKYYVKSSSANAGELEPLKRASTLAIQIIDQIREISYDLRPSQLDKLGFKKGVESLVGRLSRSSGIVISSDIRLGSFKIPPDIEINIFRIIQEGLNNVIKHSEAKSCFVKVFHKNNMLFVKISDKGKGFNPDSSLHKDRSKKKFGLKGINERATIIGGTFTLDSISQKGTTLNISIPV